MEQDPYRYFRPEARNLLDQFAQGILELEKTGGGGGAVQRLLRLAHTLKGAARVVRQSSIAERAHAIEDALAPFRESTSEMAREDIDAILAHLDEIGSQLVTLVPDQAAEIPEHGKNPAPRAQDSATGTANSSGPDPARDAQRVLRADLADADAVLEGVAEAQARLGAFRNSAVSIEQLGHLADLLQAQLIAKAANDGIRPAGSSPNRSAALAEELRRAIAAVTDEFTSSLTHLDRELRQLRDAAEGLKLIPVDSVLMALKRIARDAARSLGKQVTFEAAGGDIRLDAGILGAIQGALIQLVRNAVAHGIETETQRVAAGKPAAGLVTVNVVRRGATVLFECRDDGRGIDLAAVRRAAVASGVLSSSAAEPGGEELVRILLRGGVSTSAAVTDVAGRGVGLDVVREALERLGGDISVNIDPGRGTTFALSIPGSITSIPVLLVEGGNGGSTMAVPLDAVGQSLRLAPGDIARAAAGASILYEQHAVPFIPLAAALDNSRWSVGRGWTAIVIAGSGRIGAIGVERLVGTARMIARPLPAQLKSSPLAVGAALDGEGHPQLILDPDGLIASAHGARAAEPHAVPSQRPVLVIDDSLTTRMLEKSILESAGYEVDVASCAEDGLDFARRKSFALILCDVEMPGMDGFTFVEQLRSDPALRNVPAILVTSRSAPEDRERGRAAGAHGYIIKSEFNQAELLAMIRPMAG